MELVGVRNITIGNNEILDFEIEEEIILKVLNVSHSGNLAEQSSNGQYLLLNDEYIYFHKKSGDLIQNLPQNFPFYLNSGTYNLYSVGGKSTIYAIEFKLTTP